jgi:hypothetical protein
MRAKASADDRVSFVSIPMKATRPDYASRVLLYAGRPNWQLLPTVTPR